MLPNQGFNELDRLRHEVQVPWHLQMLCQMFLGVGLVARMVFHQRYLCILVYSFSYYVLLINNTLF